MSREYIGECPVSEGGSEFGDYEAELAIKYIKQKCGKPPRGVDVQVSWEGHEGGGEGDEVSYPAISVVWDDSITDYPGDYIGKCMEACERFDLPEEIYQRGREFFELQDKIQKLFDPD
jgi:hypothetical protein